MKLSAVILDFDGVLIDTETISRNAWMQAAVSSDLSFPNRFMKRSSVILCWPLERELQSL